MRPVLRPRSLLWPLTVFLLVFLFPSPLVPNQVWICVLLHRRPFFDRQPVLWAHLLAEHRHAILPDVQSEKYYPAF